MTSPTWDIDIKVDKRELDAKINLLETRLGVTELSAWMESDLVESLQRRASNRFASEGDDATGSWAPLSSVTEAIRSAKGFGAAHPINVRTGDLRSFMLGSRGTITTTGDDTQLQYPADPPTSELREKLATAQTGKQLPKTVMRPVVALGLTDYNEVMDLLSIYITEGLI